MKLSLEALARLATAEALQAARAQIYVASHLFQGGVLPACEFLAEAGREVAESWVETVAGKESIAQKVSALTDRAAAAASVERRVVSLGSQLFGSARFEGEEVLREDAAFRLSYLPAKQSGRRRSRPPALFFQGGFIPYGDRLFRFLPEANFYSAFLERGIAVYALEARADARTLRAQGPLPLEQMIDSTLDLAAVAFAHHRKRKLIGCGYCGSGVHLLTALSARPADAQRLFSTAALFATPLDAAKSPAFAEFVATVPRSAFALQSARCRLTGGWSDGVELWAALDMTLGKLFQRTSLGWFATGWRDPSWARLGGIGELTPAQRFALAAGYWTSTHQADRCPIPVDVVDQTIALCSEGVGADGDLRCRYRGAPVSLQALRDQTTLALVGIFGGLDPLVPPAAGDVLARILGERYRSVVNPTARHVSYVCFPNQWQPSDPQAFTPDPIEAILRAAGH